MSRDSRKKRNSLLRRWLRKLTPSDTPLGKRTTLQKFVDIVTLAWVRNQAATFLKRFFSFKTPEWVSRMGRTAFVPKRELKWYDYWNPIYWMIWSVAFGWRWLVSRPYLSAGPALFAILATVLVGGVVIKKRVESIDWRSEQYREILTQAFDKKDYPKARICLVNLIARHPDRLVHRFQQAMVDIELDREDQAMQNLMSLAFNKKHTESALWLLNKKYDLGKVQQWDNAKHEQFLALIEIARAGAIGPSGDFLRIQQARYAAARGAIGEAARLFAEAADRNHEFALLAAQLFEQVRDTESKKRYATMAKDYYQKRSLDAPNDSKARLNLAQALLILESEQQAAQVLSDGYLITKDENLKQAGGEAMAAWAVRVRMSEGVTKESLIKQIGLLKRAIEIAPKSMQVLEAFSQVAIEAADNDDEQIRSMLEAIVNGEGLTPESLHFIRGTVALFKGNLEEANLELDLAAQSETEIPGVLNNLAVVLTKQDPPDLERAFNLSQAAIARVPNHPYLLETRGQIYFKMGKYKEAIPDLEFALKAKEIAGPAHTSVAKAYEALGQKELAERHAKLAETR